MAYPADNHHKFLTGRKGFSILEPVLAAALFTIFATAAVMAVLGGLDLNRTGKEQSIANQYASEGIEAVRSIRNRDFTLLTNTAGSGITRTSGVWTFSGSNNIFDKYTRTISVGSVNRDGGGNIVASGGTPDNDTKKVTSTVNWNADSTRANSVAFNTYLTNFRKAIAGIIGDWSLPLEDSMTNLSGNGNGEKVKIQGNYAYMVRSNSTTDFVILDISDPTNPVEVGSLNSTSAINLFVSGNYAYLATGNNSRELRIIDISNPANPVQAGSYNASGNTDANAIFVAGTIAYLGRDSSTPNFLAIDVSNPANPTLLDSLSVSGNINDLIVMGNYAYIASSNSSQELQVVDISNPTSINFAGRLNLNDSDDGLSIAGFSNTIVLGREGGNVYTIDVTTPTDPSLLDTFDAGDNVNDIALGNNNTYAFLATDASGAEFTVLDISNLSAISSLGTFDMGSNQNGLDYSATLDRIVTVGTSNSAELTILKPS